MSDLYKVYLTHYRAALLGLHIEAPDANAGAPELAAVALGALHGVQRIEPAWRSSVKQALQEMGVPAAELGGKPGPTDMSKETCGAYFPRTIGGQCPCGGDVLGLSYGRPAATVICPACGMPGFALLPNQRDGDVGCVEP